MTQTLDVLLLESYPHAAHESACRGRTSSDGCPLDGHTDVAVRRFDGLRALISGRIARLLTAAAIDPAAARCSFDVTPAALDVHLALPTTVSRGLGQALAVRVLDAVRADGRTYGRVDVHVHAGESHV